MKIDLLDFKKENIFAINKPKGITSNKVIQILKKKFNFRKIGHGGTLDPMATGVLIVGVNEGTKKLQTHLNSEKEYIATIEFGYSTDTYDLEGQIVKQSEKIPSLDEIQDFILSITTKPYFQEVPLYSAVKVNGKELYKYARNNQEVESLPKKEVQLKKISIINFINNKLEVKMLVSKGFYIRSFVNDLAQFTNSCATLIGLIRTKSGDFCIENAYDV